MDQRRAARVEAAIFNNLLMPNPIFEEHDRLIEASQKQYLESKKAKDSGS